MTIYCWIIFYCKLTKSSKIIVQSLAVLLGWKTNLVDLTSFVLKEFLTNCPLTFKASTNPSSSELFIGFITRPDSDSVTRNNTVTDHSSSSPSRIKIVKIKTVRSGSSVASCITMTQSMGGKSLYTFTQSTRYTCQSTCHIVAGISLTNFPSKIHFKTFKLGNIILFTITRFFRKNIFYAPV